LSLGVGLVFFGEPAGFHFGFGQRAAWFASWAHCCLAGGFHLALEGFHLPPLPDRFPLEALSAGLFFSRA
jgi:hypothetical protein